MKRLMLIAMLACVGPAWAQTNMQYMLTEEDLAKITVGSSTDAVIVPTEEDKVRELAESGAICRVMGHNWRNGRPGESGGEIFADYHPGISYRTCAVCGATESKREGDWK